MQIVDNIESMREIVRNLKGRSTIGFVPTMGALHEGHLSLIRTCNKENDITICSIFVNPTQFNNSEDLKKYPRELDRDCDLLESNGCNYVFVPREGEIYSKANPVIQFGFGYLDEVMEGKYRPGHFNGVATIVLKLFNIVDPDKAYFGQKDLQQFVVIKSLVDELDFNLQLRCMPIVREKDGLAMSSRNMRLKDESRKVAQIFSASLHRAKALLLHGDSIRSVKEKLQQEFDREQGANLEYFEIVNAQDLRPLGKADDKINIALCIAGYVGGVRLIDNVIIEK